MEPSQAFDLRQSTEPAKVLQIEGTTIRIVAPGPMTEAERKVRHEAIVKAVARCIESRYLRS